MFKIKREYKLELQTPEKKKLIERTRKLIDKIHAGNVPSLGVVLLQYNSED